MLSPLLYNLFVADIPTPRQTNVRLGQFSDDTVYTVAYPTCGLQQQELPKNYNFSPSGCRNGVYKLMLIRHRIHHVEGFQLCFAPKRKFLRKLIKSYSKPRNLMTIYGDNQLHEETSHVYLCGTPALSFIGDVDHAEASHAEMCDGRYHSYCCSDPRSEGLQSWGHPCSDGCATYKGVGDKMSTPDQNVDQSSSSSEQYLQTEKNCAVQPYYHARRC
ncbi:hypothetical protein ANN_20602 [Periplaneta americana]|uniref:Reverse transcriptase domain-containing protein n=1 Tax=Periplaneta americana TaxID=6978 RepID=A0ABQ8SED9_PERAM|nr:hypothetical protein ANN_20602 [Periplaneta americana]